MRSGKKRYTSRRLDGLEVSSESILKAAQRSVLNIPLGIDFQKWGLLVILWGSLHQWLYVLECSPPMGRAVWPEQM